MPIRLLPVALILLTHLLAAPAAAQDPGLPRHLTDTQPTLIRLAHLSMGINQHAHAHDKKLPADLSAIFGDVWFDKDDNETIQQRIQRAFVAPGDEKRVPENATSAWIRDNSSFAYLGRPGMSLTDIPSWNKVIIAHVKPEFAYRGDPTADNPEGVWISMAAMSGESAVVSRTEFEQRVKFSNAVMDAAVNGTPFPDAVQVEWSVGILSQAIHAYTRAHDGYCPPDLGSVIDHLPVDSKRLASARQRAAVFLTPHAARNLAIPDAIDREWINQNTSYIYLGDAAARFDDIPDPFMALFHVSFDATIGDDVDGKPFRGYFLHPVGSRYEIGDREYIQTRADDARAYFEAVKTGAELPDHYQALRDLRYIAEAIRAYARAHDGKLPKDLGDTIDFLKPDEFTLFNAANVYLSPKAQRGRGEVPKNPDAEWVRANTNYVYLACNRDKPTGVQQALPIIHSPLSETWAVRRQYGPPEMIATVRYGSLTWLAPIEAAKSQISRAKEEFAK